MPRELPPTWIDFPEEAVHVGPVRELNHNYEPAEAMVEFTSLRFPRLEKPEELPQRRPKRRRSKETFVIDLADELAPLIQTVNSRFLFQSRPLESEHVSQRLVEIPWGGKTVINPCVVEMSMHLGYPGPGTQRQGLQRQTVWTLLQYAQLGEGLSAGWSPPTLQERAQGSLRALLTFIIMQESDRWGWNGPLWRYRLRVSCAEGEKLSAIRTQVSLLSRYMSDPGRLLVMNHAGMLA